MKEYKFTKTFVVVEQQESAVWVSTCSANRYRDALKFNDGDHHQTRLDLRDIHGEEFIRVDGTSNGDIHNAFRDRLGFGSLEIVERIDSWDK
jgi:hypothetical protein